MINKCCLLINDDPYDQEIFARALNDVSPETICFAVPHAYDAFFLMSEENIVPNYIFVELNMPRMNGLEFLKTIKQIDNLKDVPVIVHSTNPQPNKVIELKEFGALAIFFKPYEYNSVCNMLNLYFGSEISLVKLN